MTPGSNGGHDPETDSSPHRPSVVIHGRTLSCPSAAQWDRSLVPGPPTGPRERCVITFDPGMFRTSVGFTRTMPTICGHIPLHRRFSVSRIADRVRLSGAIRSNSSTVSPFWEGPVPGCHGYLPEPFLLTESPQGRPLVTAGKSSVPLPARGQSGPWPRKVMTRPRLGSAAVCSKTAPDWIPFCSPPVSRLRREMSGSAPSVVGLTRPLSFACAAAREILLPPKRLLTPRSARHRSTTSCVRGGYRHVVKALGTGRPNFPGPIGPAADETKGFVTAGAAAGSVRSSGQPRIVGRRAHRR